MKIVFRTLLSAWLVAVVQAALPPGVTEDLLANAEEILLVQVQSATVIEGEQPQDCYINYDVEARVLAVNQTLSGLQGGDVFQINSYTVDQESMNCMGWVGPTPPPVLEAGWCGYVHLNKNDQGGMELAAYGDSFVPADCPPVSVKPLSSSSPNTESSTSAATASFALFGIVSAVFGLL